jgi:putative transposase
MYGPDLPTREGTRRRTFLVAILDDATRLVAHAQFYFDQHLRSLKDCLRQAFLKRGLPRRLYVDNGRIFKSRLLLQLGARLGIQLVHSRPYQPQGRAKLERWFRTVRRGFLARLDKDRIEGIDDLNRLLWAFAEGEYHMRPHRGLGGQTPLDRWLALSGGLRPLPPGIDLDRLFLEHATRRVAKDGTLTLKGRTFEAGPFWIGERVSVLFDPFDLRKVVVEGKDGRAQEAFPVDLAGNRRVRREPPREPPPQAEGPPLRALEDLADRLEQDAKPEEGKENTDEA